jgi:acetylornithine/N-succinyldiaminopimelate aminotransferase
MSALYGTYARSDLAFERGEGMRLYDQHGRDYLDFHSGIAVNALGHGDAHIVSALKSAAEKVWHTSNVFTIPEQERLGQRLVDATCGLGVFHPPPPLGARMRHQDGAALFLGQG